MAEPVAILLEFTRTSEPADPYAFRLEPQDYTLVGPGGTRELVHIEWNSSLLADLQALRASERDPALVHRVGEQLQRSLESADWSRLARQITTAADDEQSVTITLRSNAAELYALPWELLTVGASGRHVGGMPHVVLRYEWPGTETTPPKPSPRSEGGRILFAWSAVTGAVPAKEHLAAIESACCDGHCEFDRDRDLVAHASAGAIVDALARAESAGQPYAVLHILCLGGQVGSTVGLMLDDSRRVAVDAGRLRELIAPYARTLRLVVLAACGSGNSGDLGNHLGSVAQALHRGGIQAVAASRYPLSAEGSTTLTSTLYRSLFVDLVSLEQALTNVRRQLARDTNTLDWASVQLYARERDGADTRPVIIRPFRGLEVFEARHRRFFFGREPEADKAERAILALSKSDLPRMFFITGASGSGKSSIARAVVVPRVAPNFKTVCITRPIAVLDEFPKSRPLLLVLDQAEEMFTDLDDEARASVMDRLFALATDPEGSVVLFTLRADFIGHCGWVVLPDGRRLDKIQSDDAHHVYATVMSPETMLEVIAGPARRIGLKIQEGLVEQLVKEVSGEPGALPLLEFALDQLWLTRDPVEGLTHEGYRSLGGSVGALLERQANALLEEMDKASRDAARHLLVQLVSAERADTRRTRELLELRLAGRERFDEVLGRLVSARLVVTSGDDTPRVEIAHEELIRQWRQLRDWVDEDRQKWIEIERVRSWTHLLRGAQLHRAREARARFGAELGKPTLGHIGSSEAALALERRRERNRQRRLRAALVISLGLAIVAIVSLVKERRTSRIAKQQETMAKESAREARESAQRALASAERARTSAKRARDNARMWALRDASDDPTTQVSLLREIEDPETAYGWRTFASKARAETISSRVLGHPAAVKKAMPSPDGAQILAEFEEVGGSSFWDWSGDVFTDPKPIKNWHESGRTLEDEARSIRGNYHIYAWYDRSDNTMPVAPGRPFRSARTVLSNDGSLAILIPSHFSFGKGPGPRKSTLLVDTTTGSVINQEWGIATSGVFSVDGTRALVSFGRSAVVWDTRRPNLTTRLEGHLESIEEVAVSPSGSQMLTCSRDKTARVWSVNNDHARVLRRLKGHSDGLTHCSFSSTGKFVVTASKDSTARVWSVDGSRPPVVLQGHEAPLTFASFSSDDTRIVTASEDMTARVWRADGAASPVVLRGHSARVNSAYFFPDGNRVVTASEDSTVRIWETDGFGNPTVRMGQVDHACFSEPGVRVGVAVPSNDYAKMFCVADGGRVFLWRSRSRGNLVLSHGSELGISSVEFSPDSQSLVVASNDGVARVFRIGDEDNPEVLWGHDDYLTSASFSPDNRKVVTTSADGTARIWQLGASTDPVVLNSGYRVEDAEFSNGGALVATASVDGVIRIWPVKGGEPTILVGHTNSVRSVAFSSSDLQLATGASDGTVRLWRKAGDGWSQEIRGEMKSGIKDVSFSPDEAWISALSWDGDAIVVSAQGEHQVHSVEYSGIEWLKFSKDSSCVEFSTKQRLVSWRIGSEGSQAVNMGGAPDREGHVAFWGFGECGEEGSSVMGFPLDLNPTEPRGTGGIIDLFWQLTTYCIPVNSRAEMLGESEEEAQDAYERCIRLSVAQTDPTRFARLLAGLPTWYASDEGV